MIIKGGQWPHSRLFNNVGGYNIKLNKTTGTKLSGYFNKKNISTLKIFSRKYLEK